MSNIRVVIADRFQLEREALVAVLEHVGFEVVAHTGSGLDAVRYADEMQPQLVILGSRIVGMSAVDAGRLLGGMRTPVTWVYLTSSPDEALATEALLAGASGFVLRSQTTRELACALTEALRGRVYIAPGVSGFSCLKPPSNQRVS